MSIVRSRNTGGCGGSYHRAASQRLVVELNAQISRAVSDLHDEALQEPALCPLAKLRCISTDSLHFADEALCFTLDRKGQGRGVMLMWLVSLA